MIQTKKYPFNLLGNGSQSLLVAGGFFKILSANGAITVTSENFQLESLSVGQGLEKTPFTRLMLKDASGSANSGVILISDENFIDPSVGNIAITANKAPISAAFVNANTAVGVASAQLIAANLNRQYLLIQNNGPFTIYIVYGAAATAALGIAIAPGGSYELVGTISTQQIFAISPGGANSGVVTVEG